MKQKQATNIALKLSAALLFLAFILLPVRFAFFAISPYQKNNTEPKIVEVTKGVNPNSLVKWLVENKVIEHGKDFLWLGRLTRQWKSLKAGEYEVSASMSPIEIFKIFRSGISIMHPITIKEGQNMYEIAQELKTRKLGNSDEFLRLCKDSQFAQTLPLFSPRQENDTTSPTPVPDTLEGYLYPDTYHFSRNTSTADIIKKMIRHFSDFWGKDQEESAQALGMTRHEIVTLASIIEKETGAPIERPMISSVFHNRLKKGMRLQSDPTTIYGMWETFDGNIRKKDLAAQNAFNTYYIKALPKGPITNPGKEAIEAALHPLVTPYYYFVSHNDGTHEFSATLEEHNRAVVKYQLRKKSQPGKSPLNSRKKALQRVSRSGRSH